MNKPAIVLGISLLLTACSTSPAKPLPEVQIVKVPVPVRCEVSFPEKPRMVFDEQAKKDMSIFEKAKLLIAQNFFLKGYTTKLEAALKACSTEVTKD